jgi:hypothetical protein
VIQHPTTTILQELLMFLQTKHLYHRFVHFLRILKKLFLSLFELLDQPLFLTLEILLLLVGMETTLTDLTTAGASRALPAISVRAHNTRFSPDETIVTRRRGRGTRLFDPISQTVIVSVLIAFRLDHGTTRHARP